MNIQRWFLLLGATPALILHAQDEMAGVQVTATQVAEHVYMLEGRGGNIGVSVGDDGILIVDDQFAPLAAKIEAAVKELNPGPFRYVLNTHHHGDHTGGNAEFAGRGATIIAHENVRKRLAADAERPRAALPVITFDHAASIYFNGGEIALLHHGPGHTDGDSVIHFTAENVVHMGDLFFNGRFPFIDLGGGGSVDGYRSSVAAVLEKIPENARIIPGHGALATVEDLRDFLAMIETTTGIVNRAIEEGRSLEEIKAAGLPDEWDGWGSGFINEERWIETIYNDATRE